MRNFRLPIISPVRALMPCMPALAARLPPCISTSAPISPSAAVSAPPPRCSPPVQLRQTPSPVRSFQRPSFYRSSPPSRVTRITSPRRFSAASSPPPRVTGRSIPPIIRCTSRCISSSSPRIILSAPIRPAPPCRQAFPLPTRSSIFRTSPCCRMLSPSAMRR